MSLLCTTFDYIVIICHHTLYIYIYIDLIDLYSVSAFHAVFAPDRDTLRFKTLSPQQR